MNKAERLRLNIDTRPKQEDRSFSSFISLILSLQPPKRLVIGDRSKPTWLVLVAIGFVVALVWATLLCVLLDFPIPLLLSASVLEIIFYLAFFLAVARWRGKPRQVLLTGLCVNLAVGLLVFWSAGVDPRAGLDIQVAGFGVLMTFGRMGCAVGGCCRGAPVHYGPEPGDYFLFPTRFLDGATWALLALLIPLVAATRPAGTAAGLALVVYSLVRFNLEFVRGDIRPYLLRLSQAQWSTLVFLPIGCWLIDPTLPPIGWPILLAACALLIPSLAVYRSWRRTQQSLPLERLRAWSAAFHSQPEPPQPVLDSGVFVRAVSTPRGPQIRVRGAGVPLKPAELGACLHAIEEGRAQERRKSPAALEDPASPPAGDENPS